MKKTFVFALLIAAIPAVAQLPAGVDGNALIRIAPDKTGPDTTGDGRQDSYDRLKLRSLLPQAVFSHKTSRGAVYKLPIDNMPCLVPDMRQVKPMPGQYRQMPESRMPNAIPKQRIIPKERYDFQQRAQDSTKKKKDKKTGND